MNLPTGRELEALKVLWRLNRATVRQIHREMCSGESDLAYTTVLSLIQTMEKKGMIGRDSEGRGKTHVYQAKVQPDKTLRSLAGNFLDRVFDGAVGQYLVSALEARKLTAQELDELQQMIVAAKDAIVDSESSGQVEGDQ